MWVFLASSITIATWRAYEAAFRVRPELRLEFMLRFVGPPILLAGAAALALRWLRPGFAAGASLGAAILAYGSARAALLALAGGGPGLSTAIERSAGVAVLVGIAIGLMWLAIRLFLSAYAWAKSDRKARDSMAAER
jgi:hypothetical protein